MAYEDYNGYRIYLYSHSYRIMTVDETVVHEVEGFRDAGDACDAAKQYINDELVGKYEVTLNTLGRTQVRQFINGYAREDSVGKVRLTMAMIAHAENEKRKAGFGEPVFIKLGKYTSISGEPIKLRLPDACFMHVAIKNNKVTEIGNIVFVRG